MASICSDVHVFPPPLRSVRPRGLLKTESTAAAVLDAETVGGRRTCLVLSARDPGGRVRDVGEEVTATLSLSQRDDEVNFGLEEGAASSEDFLLSCAVWRGAEEGRRWDLWRECPELYLVSFDSSSSNSSSSSQSRSNSVVD